MEDLTRKGSVTVNGVTFETKVTQFTSCNIIEVEVGTTAYCGGDTGHGGRTYFRIENLASTDMSAGVNGETSSANKVEIMLGGDCELTTFIGALEFAVETLKNQIANSPYYAN